MGVVSGETQGAATPAPRRWWWETLEPGDGLSITVDIPELEGVEITAAVVERGFRRPHPGRLTARGLAAGGEPVVAADPPSWVWYWTMEHDRRHTIDEANRRKKDSDPRPPRVYPDPTR